MIRWFLLIFLAAGPTLLAGIVRQNLITSAEVLQTKGVRATKVQQSGVIVSATLDVVVKTASGDEVFEAMEFVVYRDKITKDDVWDAEEFGYNKAKRRDRTSEKHATFEVIGSDVARAYLVVEFRVPSESKPMTFYRRYLLPLSEVPENQANNFPQPAAPSGRG